MKVLNGTQYELDRQRAVNHALRREKNQVLAPIVPPATFTGKLRDYQSVGVAYLIANQRALLADGAGVGKTVQALAGLCTVNQWPAIVVCNANVCTQWQRMVGEFCSFADAHNQLLFHDATGRSASTILYGLKTKSLPVRNIYIVHYGLLRAWGDLLRELNPKTIVFDEIQDLRHTGTMKYSVASMLAGECDYVWGLSATPTYNYGAEIWSVMNILDYHCLGDFDSFSREWCTGYGDKVVKDPERLGAYLRSEGLMLRRIKDDVLSELPPKQRIVVSIDHDDDVYAKMIREVQTVARSYEKLEGFRERGAAALQIENESRRATGVSKAPHVAAFVLSLLEAGEKPLVYAWHHDVHNIIGTEVGKHYPFGRITGHESQEEKDLTIARFGEGKLDWLMISLRSTQGIDGLQGQGTCIVFAELDWSPAVHTQCEDRLHRYGMKQLDNGLMCYYLMSQTGYDGVVMDALGLKISQFVGIMGDKPTPEADEAAAVVSGKKILQRLIDTLKTRHVHQHAG